MQENLYPVSSIFRSQSFNPQRGFAMLEQTIALGGLLLLALAAFDLNKFLQAYQALQLGVEASLRKCYVTDGGCLSPKDQEEISLFKIWQKPIRAYEQDYTGNAWFLEVPNLRFPNPSARVLDSSLSTYMKGKGVLSLLKHTAGGSIYYGLQTSELPRLEIFDARRHIELKGEHLVYLDLAKHCSLHDQTGRRVSNLEQIGGTTSSTLPIGIGSLRCMIPSPFRESTALAKASTKACFTSFRSHEACDDSWKSGTRIALVIEGESHAAGNLKDPSGKTGILISQKGNRALKGAAQQSECDAGVCDYGGRIFRGPGTFNFVPRGLPLGNLSESLKCQGCSDIKQQCNESCASYKELYKHDSIWVKYDQDFEISFNLKKVSGFGDDKVSWNTTGIRIFVVSHEARKEKVICGDKLKKSQIINGSAECKYLLSGKPYLQDLHVHDLAVIDAAAPERSSLGITRCVSPSLPEKDSNGRELPSIEERKDYQHKLEQTAACAANGDLKNCFVDYDLHIDPDASDCGLYSDAPQKCPQNYGISKYAQEEWDPVIQRYVIKDNPEASNACPAVRSETLDPDARLLSTAWIQHDIALPPIQEIFNAQNCQILGNLNSLDIPSPYSLYRNLDIGPFVIEGSTPLGLGAEIDPRKEKELNSLYSCKEVKVRQVSVQALNEKDYGCEWAINAKALVQKSLALSASLPSAYYFEPLSKTRSVRQGKNIFYDSPSALDACTDYEVTDEIAFIPERKYLGLYAAGSYPSSCTPIDPKDPDGKLVMSAHQWCLFQSAGNMAQGGGGLDLVNSESTRAAGLRAIKTFFPAAKADCKTQSPYCVSFEGPELLIQDGKTVFQASASVDIPVSAFLGKNMPIRVSDSRIWEGEFAK